MFEIKLSKGAKPSKSAMLAGVKVSIEFTEIWRFEIREAAISHKELSSNDDLLDMVTHMRVVTGKPIGFKADMFDPTLQYQPF